MALKNTTDEGAYFGTTDFDFLQTREFHGALDDVQHICHTRLEQIL